MILGNCTARFQCDKFGKILSSVHTTADYKALNGRLITEKHFNAKTALPHTLRVNSPYFLTFLRICVIFGKTVNLVWRIFHEFSQIIICSNIWYNSFGFRERATPQRIVNSGFYGKETEKEVNLTG